MSDNESEQLVFMMGEFEARFPTDRMYAQNHMWAKDTGSTKATVTWRFGFTSYAVRLLQDVYFLDWTVDAKTQLSERQEIGEIESKKAESALYSPLAGTLDVFNEQVLSDPSSINVSTYDEGWLFEMSHCPPESLMTAAAYIDHLEKVWVVTQRTIKGQLN